MASGFLLDWSAYARVLLAARRPDSGRRLGTAEVARFRQLVLEDHLFVSTPFRLEAQYSALGPEEFRAFATDLDSFKQAEASGDTWLLAERAQTELADEPSVSHRVKPIDLLIAAIADQHGIAVLHYDSDYDTISKHTSLRFESSWLAEPGSID